MEKLEKIKSKGSFVFLLFLAIVLFAFLFYLEQNNQGTKKYEKVISGKEAILIIDYGNQKQRLFKGEVVDGMTVFDALTTASLAGKFTFQANSHLSQIDNMVSDSKSKWICYLNDQEIKKSLNQTIIRPKDKILCKYR